MVCGKREDNGGKRWDDIRERDVEESGDEGERRGGRIRVREDEKK
jgi:hypothetical protein